MFRSTVMCGNRLNDWKTMPILRRTRLTSTWGAVISSPSTTMRPESMGSTRFTHLRASTCRSRRPRSGRPPRGDPPQGRCPCSTALSPNDLLTRSTTSAGERVVRSSVAHAAAPAWRRRWSRAIRRSVKRASGIVIRTNRQRGDYVARVVELGGAVDLRPRGRLYGTEDRDQRRVLLQPDEVVKQRRYHAPDGLRQDHEPQGLPAREAERTGRRATWLSCTESMPAR